MKAVLITLFLNYGLFFCKTVNRGTLNDTILKRRLHKSLREIDTLLLGVQKEIKNDRKILRSQVNYENAPIPESDNLLDYDVTDLFWGDQTGLQGMTHEDVTSTFLPSIELQTTQTPIVKIEEDTSPTDLVTPKTSIDFFYNTNYPGYPYEPPPFNDVVLAPLPTRPAVTRNDSFDIFITPPNFDKLTSFKDPNQYYRLLSLSYEVPRLPSDIDKHYTLKPVPIKPTISTAIPLTTTPFTPRRTTRSISKYLMRYVQKPNLDSGATISGKEMENFINWFSQATAGRPVQKWTTKISFLAGLTTMPKTTSILSKAQMWFQKYIKNPVTPIHREGGPAGSLPPSIDSEIFIATIHTERHVPQTTSHEMPETLPHDNPLTHTTVILGVPVTAQILFGDVGAGISTTTTKRPPRKVYYEMMQELNEGFLTIFLLEIFRITSLKNEKHVKEVLVEVELYVNNWYDTNRPTWFGPPLVDVVVKLSRFVSAAQIDYVRSYSAMLYNVLQSRKTAVAVDVNAIIDYADLMYNEKEGGDLFDAIIEYDQYPRGTKNAKELCEFMFDSFMRPYRRLGHSMRRQTLLDSVNYALRVRFPLRTNMFEDFLNIEPQTTTKMKAVYPQQVHKRSRDKRKRKNKKQEATDDVIHFSSKTTRQYLKDLRTPLIHNYMLKATKTNHKSAKDKTKSNKNKETTIRYKNLISDTSFENQKKSKINLKRHTNKKTDFNDFDDTKHETAESDKYSLSNSNEMKEILKKVEEKIHFELYGSNDKEDDVSTNELEAMKENLQVMIDKAQADEDYNKMNALKSYAQIFNEDNYESVHSKNSGADLSQPSDEYS